MEQRLSDEGVSEIMKRQGSLGGYLIPPDCVLGGPIVIDIQDAPAIWSSMTDAEIDRIKAEFETMYLGNSSSPAILYTELSSREESLLREAPVFRTSQLEEPQPDVIVKPNKESQC